MVSIYIKYLKWSANTMTLDLIDEIRKLGCGAIKPTDTLDKLVQNGLNDLEIYKIVLEYSKLIPSDGAAKIIRESRTGTFPGACSASCRMISSAQ